VYKIAIVGAATLLGKELKDSLTESSLAAEEIALFDEDEGLGQLDQLGDEVTFVQAIRGLI
jgi:aspartate-semialdehyde dehydrogenase